MHLFFILLGSGSGHLLMVYWMKCKLITYHSRMFLHTFDKSHTIVLMWVYFSHKIAITVWWVTDVRLTVGHMLKLWNSLPSLLKLFPTAFEGSIYSCTPSSSTEIFLHTSSWLAYLSLRHHWCPPQLPNCWCSVRWVQITLAPCSSANSFNINEDWWSARSPCLSAPT